MIKKAKLENFKNFIDNENYSNGQKVISYEIDTIEYDYVVQLDHLKYYSIVNGNIYSLLEKTKDGFIIGGDINFSEKYIVDLEELDISLIDLFRIKMSHKNKKKSYSK